MDRYIIFGLLLLASQPMLAQSHDMLMNQGDQAYRSEQYDQAFSYYAESDLKRPGLTSVYNQANALFNQEKLEEAITLWQRASNSESENIKTAALHNLGNAYLNSQKLEEAIDAYKQALRINPKDDDTRRNLALAQNMQQEKENQENKENSDKDQSQEQEDNKNNEDEQQEDQNSDNQKNKKEQNENQNQQQQNQNSENQKNKDGEAEQQLKKMTKQELQQLLKILEEEDKKVQQKAAIRKSNGRKKDKQW